MGTDSTIDSELILLKDNWPGGVEDREVPYGDGLLDYRYHNVATPKIAPGTKIQLYNTGLGKAGFSIFIYLQVGTQNGASALAVKSVVVPDSATIWYQVTNDPDDCIKLPTNLMAVALSAMTNAYWGWFWCGGVCPETFVPGLGGTYNTDGGVVAGHLLAHNLTHDFVGFSKVSAVNEPPAGFALAADA